MSLSNGRKRLIDMFEDEASNSSNSKRLKLEKPLRGIVACLSGLPSQRKAQLHSLIEKLGGNYTRDFDLDKNTHLITDRPQGAKFDLAMSCPEMYIVSPAWLDACFKAGKRVSEIGFAVLVSAQKKKPPPPLPEPASPTFAASLFAKNDNFSKKAPPNNYNNNDDDDRKKAPIVTTVTTENENETETEAETTTKSKVKATRKQEPLIVQLDELLGCPKNNVTLKPLFQNHHFMLLGFDEDLELKKKLSMLIRRAMGTIYWEMHEGITIMVLHSTCHESIRKAASLASTHQPKRPGTVSPMWVIESWKRNYLPLPTEFPPIIAHVTTKPLVSKDSIISEASTMSRTASTSSIFRGCLFSLVRAAPPSWAVDFDSKKQESFIKLHGGQMLTLKLVDALRADSKRGCAKRRCHVVCWGSRPRLELHPILANIQRSDLCDIILVTPLWLQTCVKVEKRLRPDRLPFVFSPQPWPFRKLGEEQQQQGGKKVAIAMTGFHWIERTALAQVVEIIGGTFHENMSVNSTHLVCKEKATGLKLEKAIEWGLHIVSVEWLHHIAQYGYGGKEQAEEGCESRFSRR